MNQEVNTTFIYLYNSLLHRQKWGPLSRFMDHMANAVIINWRGKIRRYGTPASMSVRGPYKIQHVSAYRHECPEAVLLYLLNGYTKCTWYYSVLFNIANCDAIKTFSKGSWGKIITDFNSGLCNSLLEIKGDLWVKNWKTNIGYYGCNEFFYK